MGILIPTLESMDEINTVLPEKINNAGPLADHCPTLNAENVVP